MAKRGYDVPGPWDNRDYSNQADVKAMIHAPKLFGKSKYQMRTN